METLLIIDKCTLLSYVPSKIFTICAQSTTTTTIYTTTTTTTRVSTLQQLQCCDSTARISLATARLAAASCYASFSLFRGGFLGQLAAPSDHITTKRKSIGDVSFGTKATPHLKHLVADLHHNAFPFAKRLQTVLVKTSHIQSFCLVFRTMLV